MLIPPQNRGGRDDKTGPHPVCIARKGRLVSCIALRAKGQLGVGPGVRARIHFSTASNDNIPLPLSPISFYSPSPSFIRSPLSLTPFIIISQTTSRQLRMMDVAVPFRDREGVEGGREKIVNCGGGSDVFSIGMSL